MNYPETLDYLFNKLPMFTRIGAAAYKADLTNTLLLCEALGNPQRQFKSIHVAGTNGKGSTSHMLAAILQTGGYKTGLYTSPHLHDFRERIKIDGALCDEQFVINFTQQIQPLIESLQPSFFEITVAMAFAYFAQQQVDIAVIEVGLGGRLDSTNIITPQLSVITNIGYDHMNLLGDTLPQIAFEKAGIIKPQVPVVIGEYLPETKPVFEAKAFAEKAPIYFAAHTRYVIGFTNNGTHLTITVAENKQNVQTVYELDVQGVYQTKNLVTVLEAASQLKSLGWNTSTQIVQKALQHIRKTTGFHGRWETIHQHPTIITDVGHNEDGVAAIVQQLELNIYQHLHIVIGMVKDKAIDKVLQLLPHHATYYFTQAQIPRALEASLLQEQAGVFGLKGNAFTHVNEALHTALQHAHNKDLILVCGSFFIVAEVDMAMLHS